MELDAYTALGDSWGQAVVVGMEKQEKGVFNDCS